jgi:hypothetical protein
MGECTTLYKNILGDRTNNNSDGAYVWPTMIDKDEFIPTLFASITLITTEVHLKSAPL